MKLSKKRLERLLLLADQGASTSEHRNLIEQARRALLGPEKPPKTPSQRGKASREKGQRVERQWCAFLKDEGLFPEACRGYQARGGGKEEADIRGTDPFHFEVKGCERLSLYEAMGQARKDCEALGPVYGVAEGDPSIPSATCEERIPVLAHRRNDHPWLVVMLATDWAELVRRSDLLDQGLTRDVSEQMYGAADSAGNRCPECLAGPGWAHRMDCSIGNGRGLRGPIVSR